MARKYFEDFKVGDKFVSARKTITEAMITIAIGVGGYTNPLFLDEETAKGSRFGGRIAPGRLTFFIMGGLEEESVWHDTPAILVGVNNMTFKNPLRAGDTIRCEVEILELRESSKAQWGLERHKSTCLNQRNEVVCEHEATHLIECRLT
jgi:acyl dehydratase